MTEILRVQVDLPNLPPTGGSPGGSAPQFAELERVNRALEQQTKLLGELGRDYRQIGDVSNRALSTIALRSQRVAEQQGTAFDRSASRVTRAQTGAARRVAAAWAVAGRQSAARFGAGFRTLGSGLAGAIGAGGGLSPGGIVRQLIGGGTAFVTAGIRAGGQFIAGASSAISGGVASLGQAAAGLFAAIPKVGSAAASIVGAGASIAGGLISGLGSAVAGATGVVAEIGSALGQRLGEAAGTAVNVAFGAALAVGIFSARGAAQTEQATTAFSGVAKSVGIDATSALEQFRVASRGTLADFQLLQSATRAFNSEIVKTPPQFAELITLSRRLATASGITATEGLRRLTQGLAKQEVELLDELGLKTRLIDALKAEARQRNVAVEALTLEQRQQAFVNAILDEGRTKVSRLGEEVITSAQRWQQFTASVRNTADEIGGPLLAAFDALQPALVETAQAIGRVFSENSVTLGKQLAGVGQDIGDGLRSIITLAEREGFEGFFSRGKSAALDFWSAFQTVAVASIDVVTAEFEELLRQIRVGVAELPGKALGKLVSLSPGVGDVVGLLSRPSKSAGARAELGGAVTGLVNDTIFGGGVEEERRGSAANRSAARLGLEAALIEAGGQFRDGVRTLGEILNQRPLIPPPAVLDDPLAPALLARGVAVGLPGNSPGIGFGVGGPGPSLGDPAVEAARIGRTAVAPGSASATELDANFDALAAAVTKTFGNIAARFPEFEELLEDALREVAVNDETTREVIAKLEEERQRTARDAIRETARAQREAAQEEVQTARERVRRAKEEQRTLERLRDAVERRDAAIERIDEALRKRLDDLANALEKSIADATSRASEGIGNVRAGFAADVSGEPQTVKLRAAQRKINRRQRRERRDLERAAFEGLSSDDIAQGRLFNRGSFSFNPPQTDPFTLSAGGFSKLVPDRFTVPEDVLGKTRTPLGGDSPEPGAELIRRLLEAIAPKDSEVSAEERAFKETRAEEIADAKARTAETTGEVETDAAERKGDVKSDFAEAVKKLTEDTGEETPAAIAELTEAIIKKGDIDEEARKKITELLGDTLSAVNDLAKRAKDAEADKKELDRRLRELEDTIRSLGR